MLNAVQEVQGLGQSIWYDNIRRGLIKSGELKSLIDLGVSGVTSNPTIFEKAIAGKERNLTAAVSSAIAGEPLADRQRILQAIQQEDTAIRPRLLREIVARLENKSIFDLLTNFVIFAGSIFYSLCVLAVIILRFKHPEWPRPYRTWGYPVIPLLFLAFYAWFLTVVFIGEPFEALAGIALIALGLPVHWWWNRRNKPRTANLQH